MGNPIGVSGTITGYGRPPDPNSVTGYRSACLYKGVVYNQGDTWEDGCDYDCECTDASAGKYICTERCQRFGSIPNGCSLVPDANDRCCQQVTCVPTAAATPGPNSGPCQDKLNNCYLYGKSSCTGQYLQWAQDNCAAYCGICGTTASTKCEDKIPNCVDFGSDSCSGGFTSWAEYNCPKTCGLCGTTTANPINVGGFTNPPSGGISPGTSQCVDKLPNCASYGDDSCRSPYEKWALENCPARCNLCSQLIAGGGTAGGNTGFNPGSFTIDPNAGVVTGVGAAGCYYKGKLYQQGEDWQVLQDAQLPSQRENTVPSRLHRTVIATTAPLRTYTYTLAKTENYRSWMLEFGNNVILSLRASESLTNCGTDLRERERENWRFAELEGEDLLKGGTA